MKGNPEKIKLETKDDENKELKNKTEKDDYENFLKSLKIDKEFFKIYIY